MILRIKLATKRNNFDRFSEKFVKGGLPFVRVSQYHRFDGASDGVSRKVRPVPLKRRPNGLVVRFRYRLHRKFTHGLRLPIIPLIQKMNTRNFTRESTYHQVSLAARRYSFFRRYQWFGFPATPVLRRAARLIQGYVIKKKRGYEANPTFRLGFKVKDYDYKFRARIKFQRRLSAFASFRKKLFGYTPRWCVSFKHTTSGDPIFIKRNWSRHSRKPWLATRPTLFNVEQRTAVLTRRYKVLSRKKRYARAWKRRAQYLKKYRRWFFRKLAKAMEPNFKLSLRLRKRRLRKKLMRSYRKKKYFARITRASLPRASLPRVVVEEYLQSLKPTVGTYSELNYEVVKEMSRQPIRSILEYTYFTELPQQLQEQRKKPKSRRYRLQDHPKVGRIFTRLFSYKLDWFNRAPIQQVADQNRVDPRQRSPAYNELSDPTNHPLNYGPWAWAYWTTTFWGRGSFWRSKPVKRARRVFIKSIRSGFVTDAESKSWASAARSALLSKFSLLSEIDHSLHSKPEVVDLKIKLGWFEKVTLKVKVDAVKSFVWRKKAIAEPVFSTVWSASNTAVYEQAVNKLNSAIKKQQHKMKYIKKWRFVVWLLSFLWWFFTPFWTIFFVICCFWDQLLKGVYAFLKPLVTSSLILNLEINIDYFFGLLLLRVKQLLKKLRTLLFGAGRKVQQRNDFAMYQWYAQGTYRNSKPRLFFINLIRFIGWNLLGILKAFIRTLSNTFKTSWFLFLQPFRLIKFILLWVWNKLLFGTFFVVVFNFEVLMALHQVGKNAILERHAFRRLRWVYLAWLQAYNNNDFADETVNPEMDTEIHNWQAAEENDVAQEFGEEIDTDGVYFSMMLQEPRDSWWDHDIEEFMNESEEIMTDLLLEELPYYIRLVTRPFIDGLIRLPFWGLLEGVAIFWLAAKKEFHSAWLNLLTYGDTGKKITGRWWKVPLIMVKLALHAGVWVSLYSFLLNLFTPDQLNLWITYSCGLTWYDEYYFLWVVVCFVLTVWLAGPHYLRDYIYQELGPENIAFITFAALSLGTPEEYYPQRPMSDLHRLWLKRNVGLSNNKPFYYYDTGATERGNMGSTFSIMTYDDIRSTIAVYHELQGYVGYDIWDTDPTINPTPSRYDNDWYPAMASINDGTGEGEFYHRHPFYYRNNYMTVPRNDLYPEFNEFDRLFFDECEDNFRNDRLYHRQHLRDHSGNIKTYSSTDNPNFIGSYSDT